jgi:beta-xylosidase
LWHESNICSTKAPSPVLPGAFADPHVAVFNGKYYIYPTTDGFEGWSSDYFTVWSSKDMKKWKKEGTILDFKKDLTWAQSVLGHPQLLSKTINTTSIFRQIPTSV